MRELAVFGVLAVLWLIWRAINAATLKDILSPFNVLFFLWIIPLVGSYLNWSNLQRGLSDDAVAMIGYATLILIVTSLLPMAILRDAGGAGFRPDATLWQQTIGARMLIVLLCIIGSAAFIAAEFNRGIPLFQYWDVMASSADLHRYGKDSRLQTLAIALPVSGLLAYWITLTSRDIRTKCFFLVIAALPIVLGILKTSKSDIFNSAFYYLALHYYWSSRRKRTFSPKKVGLVIAVAAFLFVGVTLVRLSGDSRAPDQTYSELIDFKYANTIPWPANEGLSMLYGYSMVEFDNLSRFMMFGHAGSHWGASMLRPFLSMFMQGKIARDMVEGYESTYYEMSGAANMGTYLRDLYFEGGMSFCIIGTLIYGLFVNFIYITFRKRRSALWACIYVNFLFAWGWLVFNNMFAVLALYVSAAYMVIVVVGGNGLTMRSRSQGAFRTNNVAILADAPSARS